MGHRHEQKDCSFTKGGVKNAQEVNTNNLSGKMNRNEFTVDHGGANYLKRQKPEDMQTEERRTYPEEINKKYWAKEKRDLGNKNEC